MLSNTSHIVFVSTWFSLVRHVQKHALLGPAGGEVAALLFCMI
jgi:hypothetical protein